MAGARLRLFESLEDPELVMLGVSCPADLHLLDDGNPLSGRLIRLVPEDEDEPERLAIKNLLNHRLPNDGVAARLEWLEIVEGRHVFWTGVSFLTLEVFRVKSRLFPLPDFL